MAIKGNDMRFIDNRIEEDVALCIEDNSITKFRGYEVSKSEFSIEGYTILLTPFVKSPILIKNNNKKMIICNDDYLQLIKNYKDYFYGS